MDRERQTGPDTSGITHHMLLYPQVNRVVIREKGNSRLILIQSDQGLVLFNRDLDHVLWNKREPPFNLSAAPGGET